MNRKLAYKVCARFARTAINSTQLYIFTSQAFLGTLLATYFYEKISYLLVSEMQALIYAYISNHSKALQYMKTYRIFFSFLLSLLTLFFFSCGGAPTETAVTEEKSSTLKIGYSDWPGWVAWEIAIQKKWFEEEGVDVEFLWFDYVASMDAYVAGQVDAVCMTNGDALVTGATGKPSVGIIVNDYSNGNDMVVAKPGIESVADLKGKSVAVEEGFVCHLLLLKALEENGMSADDVTIVNTPTDETPQVLASGDVDAIAAWQPNSGQALKSLPGSKPIFTSADAPGIIYDLLCVSSESLEANKEDWAKVVLVWYRIVDYLMDEENMDEALKILSARVSLDPAEYEPFFKGTKILTLDEALKYWAKGAGLDSVYGSTDIVDDFNVKFEVYEEPLDTGKYLDPSLTQAFAEKTK